MRKCHRLGQTRNVISGKPDTHHHQEFLNQDIATKIGSIRPKLAIVTAINLMPNLPTSTTRSPLANQICLSS
jgi:hypothetical protein